MNSKSLVLIVSPPGDLQIGLQALLTTHLDVDVLVVSEAASALKFIEKNNPDLVMLDQDISENTASKLVDDIKTSWPEIICVVLVNDDQVRQKIDAAGANLVIVKGLAGAKLVAETKKLLDMKGEK